MNKYLAEGFGTMILVLVGCGAAVISGEVLGLLGVALAFGLAVVGMAYTIGNISGCHINPAITLAMWMHKKISASDAAWYMVAQFIGAIIGAWVVGVLAGDFTNLAANGYAPYYGTAGLEVALLTEIIFTALFITVILGVTSSENFSTIAGWIIGMTLSVCIMVAGPITNAALNPARAFGPAMIEGGQALSQVWVFFVGPFGGAILAWLIWVYLFGNKA